MYRAWVRPRSNIFPKNSYFRGYSENPGGSGNAGKSKIPFLLGLGAAVGATYYVLAYPVPGLDEYKKQLPFKVPQLPPVEDLQGYVKSLFSSTTQKPKSTPPASTTTHSHQTSPIHEEKTHHHDHSDESILEPVVVIGSDPIVVVEEVPAEESPDQPASEPTTILSNTDSTPLHETTHEPEIHTIEPPHTTEHVTPASTEETEPQVLPHAIEYEQPREEPAPESVTEAEPAASTENTPSPAENVTAAESAAAENAAATSPSSEEKAAEAQEIPAMAVVLEVPLVELESDNTKETSTPATAVVLEQKRAPTQQESEEPQTKGNLLIGFSLQQVAKAFNILQTTDIGSATFEKAVDSLPIALKTLVVALASDIVSRQAHLIETFRHEFDLQEVAHQVKFNHLALSKEEQLKKTVENLEFQMQQILDQRIKELEKMKQDELMEEFTKLDARNKEELQRIKELRLKHHYNRLDMIRQLSVTLDSYKHLLQASSNYDLKSQHVHRLTLALIALADAMEAGKPLAPQVYLLRTLAKDNATVEAALDALPNQIVEKGVSTRAELITRFHTVYNEGRKAAFVPEGGGLWWLVYSTVLSAVTIDEKGLVQGSDTKHVLARALYWAEKDRLDKSLEELAQLKGIASTIVSDWCKDATNRLLLEQAVRLMKAQVACEASSLA